MSSRRHTLLQDIDAAIPVLPTSTQDLPLPAHSESGITVATIASPMDTFDVVDGVVLHTPHVEDMKLLNTKWKQFATVTLKDGKSLILNRLAQNEWSSVYSVSSLVGLCALKVVPARGYSSRKTLAEVKLLRHLRHSNIAQYQGHFIYLLSHTPFLCLRLEYCTGGTLQSFILEKRRCCSKPEIHFIAELMSQLASALNYIHHQGLLHGDIRAMNVALMGDSQVKLIGFAVGFAARPANGKLTTITGGHCQYVPPEWARSELPSEPPLPHNVPPSYDMWCTGCLLSELVTRKLLPEHRLPKGQILADTPSNLQELHCEMENQYKGAFASICKSLLTEDPGNRMSAGELQEALKPLVESEPSIWSRIKTMTMA